MKSKGLAMITYCSFLICITFIVTASLSPLSQYIETSLPLGVNGMYTIIGLTAVCYVIPFILYVAGLRKMVFVMALFCCAGILSTIFFSILFLIYIYISHYSFGIFIIPGIIGFFFTITNIVWLLVAFRQPNPAFLHTSRSQALEKDIS